MTKTRKNVAACMRRAYPYAKKLEKRYIKNALSTIKSKMIKKTLRGFLEADKKGEKDYELMVCNPGCKDTFFEAGKKMPKSYEKMIMKKYPFVLDTMKLRRKQIFGNKTSVLRNNFYEKIPAANIKSLKKHGALSGCLQPMQQSQDFKNIKKMNK